MLALLLVAVSVGVDNFAAAIAIGVSGVDARTRVRVALVFGTIEAGMPVLGLAIGAQTAGLLGHAARWTGGALLVAVGGYAIVGAIRERAKADRGSTETGTAETGTIETGTLETGTLETGTAETGTAETGTAPGGANAAGSAAPAGPVRAEACAGRPEAVGGSRPAASSSFARLLVGGLALSLDNLAVGFALGANHTSIVLGAIVIGVVCAALSLAGLELGARAGSLAGERAEPFAGLLLIFVGVALGTGLLG